MAEVKMSWVFNAGKLGWSETWYMTRDSLQAALDDATALVTQRSGLLGTGAYIEAIRVSDLDVFGDSLVGVRQLPVVNQQANALVRDNPWNALFARGQAGALYRRGFWMRGVPDNWIIIDPANGGVVIAPGMQTALDAFKVAAIAKGLSLRVLNKTGAEFRGKTISIVATGADGNFVITAPGHGLANTNSVRIKGVKGIGLENLKGVWVVYSTTVDTFQIGLKPLGAAFTYRGGGTTNKRGYTLAPLTNLTYLRSAKKSTGRAFFLPAGRRRARR